MYQNFDDIRPYRTDEIPMALHRLTEEKQFMKIVSTIFPLMPKIQLKEKIQSYKDTDTLQKELIYPYLKYLEANKTKGISMAGLDSVLEQQQQPCTFVSNHRDIVLDSAFLCLILIEKNVPTVEIAIGDNLLIYPWIREAVRVNKNFIVHRGLTPRETLKSSQKLSAYIRHTLYENKHSIWIAQREGRAKDANDLTQESLIKMFSLSGTTNNLIENLKELNICPLTISYEYDPCDYLKANEFYQKTINPDYKKTPQDDLLNMQTGILGYKGKVTYYASNSINDQLDKIPQTIRHKNELIKQIAQLIDQNIHRHYTIYPINKWAYDVLHQTTYFENTLTKKEKEEARDYLQCQLAKINAPTSANTFLYQKLLEMYANPLKNKMANVGIQHL